MKPFVLHTFLTCVFLFGLLSNSTVSAQNQVDSLNKIILTEKGNTITKGKAFLALAEIFYVENNIDTVLFLSKEAIANFKKINLQTLTKNNYFEYQKNYALALNNIGVVYYYYGSYAKAIDYYLQALKIREKIKDDEGLTESFNNIAGIYKLQRDTLQALNYYKKSIAIAQKRSDTKGLSNGLNNIAIIYQASNPKLALKYFFKSLEIEIGLNNVSEISKREQNIAVLYESKGDYQNAKKYYNLSLQTKRKIEDKKGLSTTLISLSNLQLELSNIDEAEKLANEAYHISKENEYLSNNILSAELLYRCYMARNKYKEAIDIYVELTNNKQIQIEDANQTEAIRLQLQYGFNEKLAADSLKTANERQIIELKLKKEKEKQIALFIILFIVLIFFIIMFNRFKVTKRQKKTIENQKKIVEVQKQEITDSINYAKRIQNALLANEEILKNNLKDYFVIFKPKSIVSGDFYWAKKMNNGNFIFVIADSTGHGVPGAIMSVLNISCIEKAIETHDMILPSDILNYTRTKIIEILAKDGSKDGGKDGMDCSVLVFDTKNKQLLVSSANNSVFIVRNNELIEIKADKMPVGRSDKSEQPFTLNQFSLNENDKIYALTDGFPDQFGGPNCKKFMRKRLKELLVANSHLPFLEQKNQLELIFNNWSKGQEQIDDITIIGMSV